MAACSAALAVAISCYHNGPLYLQHTAETSEACRSHESIISQVMVERHIYYASEQRKRAHEQQKRADRIGDNEGKFRGRDLEVKGLFFDPKSRSTALELSGDRRLLN